MRWTWLLTLVLAGCPRSEAPPAPPLPPQRCPAGAYRHPDPALCLALPPGYQLARKEKEPAFDRLVLGFQTADDAPEILLTVQWFPNGRPVDRREADFHEQVEALRSDKPEALAESPTDDGSGTYVRGKRGAEFVARSVVRSEHYRIRCEVAGEAESVKAALEACRTLSPPP